jgi:hypothetical protein
MFEKLKNIIFWISISFIAFSIISLTIGLMLPYEFCDNKLKNNFYLTIIIGLPIGILFTLFGTIKKKNSRVQNWILLVVTVLISIVSFNLILGLILKLSFGSWRTVTTIYRHKTKDLEIKEQWYDVGGLGYGGHRIVEIKPFLYFWILPKPIELLKINKTEWVFVNEQGSIKLP